MTDASLLKISAEISEIKKDVADIKYSIEPIVDAILGVHDICKSILELCQGDGSGELVQALNNLTTAVKDMSSRVDGVVSVAGDIPAAVVAELEVKHGGGTDH